MHVSFILGRTETKRTVEFKMLSHVIPRSYITL